MPPDAHLERILEQCYSEIIAGRTPDIGRLCSSDADLERRVRQILAREQAAWDGAADTPPSGSATLRIPPRAIGDYDIIAPLGSGGMGDVYVAEQRSLKRRVALKLLRFGTERRASVLRFRREAEITGALDHPNIVPVYDTGEENGVVYLAMKLLRGDSLAQGTSLPPRRVAEIGARVGTALEATHRVGVLHRDVKPGNIVLADDTPYLLDFGLARLRDPASALTQSREAPGTLAYMAPETLRSSSPVWDPRIDVYGLGATLWEAVRGKPPFDASLEPALIRQILTEEPPRLGLTGDDRDLEVVLRRALEKEPARRYPTAAALADDLQRFADGRPILARPPGPVERLRRRARRNPAAAALLGLVAIASCIALGFAVDARRSRAAAIREGSAQVQDNLRRGFLNAATSQLQRLRTTHGETPVLRGLDRELRSAQSVFALHAHLARAPGDYASNTLQDLSAQLAANPPADNPSLAALTLAAADLRLARPERARERLASVEPSKYPRATAVLSAIASGGDAGVISSIRTDLPTAEDEDHDRFLATVGLWVAGRPWQELWQQVERSPTQSNSSLTLLRTTLLVRAGRFPTAYEALAQVAKQAATRPLAVASQARIAATLGRGAAARRHLTELAAVLDSATTQGVQSILTMSTLEALRSLREYEDFWATWDGASSLTTVARYWLEGAYVSLGQGNTARGLELLHRALACPEIDDDTRRLVDLAIVQAELTETVASLGQTVSALDPDARLTQRDALRSISIRAADVAARFVGHGSHSLRADAQLTAARAHFALEEDAAGWRMLREACRAPDHANAYSVFASEIVRRLHEPDRVLLHNPDLTTADLTDAAIRYSRAVLAEHDESGAHAALLPSCSWALFCCARDRRDYSNAADGAIRVVTLEIPQAADICLAYLRDLGGVPAELLPQGVGSSAEERLAALDHLHRISTRLSGACADQEAIETTWQTLRERWRTSEALAFVWDDDQLAPLASHERESWRALRAAIGR